MSCKSPSHESMKQRVMLTVCALLWQRLWWSCYLIYPNRNAIGIQCFFFSWYCNSRVHWLMFRFIHVYVLELHIWLLVSSGSAAGNQVSLGCPLYWKVSSIAVHWKSSSSNCCNCPSFDEMYRDTMWDASRKSGSQLWKRFMKSFFPHSYSKFSFLPPWKDYKSLPVRETCRSITRGHVFFFEILTSTDR